MQSRYPELSALGIIAAILVLIPLPRQIRARNVAIIAMIFWCFEHCLVSGVNAIVWAGNVNDSAPAWCEISEVFCDIFNHRALIQDIRSATYLRDGAGIGLPAATLCICKYLEFISSGRPVSLYKRRTYFEVFMCIVLPCIWMFLCELSSFTSCSNFSNSCCCSVYCFQSARYYIIEDFGCISGFWTSYASIIILFVPPLGLTVVALVYGSEQASYNNLATTYLIISLSDVVVAFYHLILNHRIKTKILTPHLVSRNSGLSSSQYYRLMTLSMVIGIWALVWISLQLKNVIQSGITPLPDWRALHQEDSIVVKVPLAVLSPSVLASYRLFWWSIPGAAYIFFVLFAINGDVFSEYIKFWIWFKTTVLRRPLPEKVPTLRSG
jgi:Pheromone A receptor